MNEHQPQIVWELTRAIVSIAAWFVLFYRLHRPQALWRRIALLVAMPAAYTAWILTPMSVLGNAVSWAGITIIFALICGDLRRSLFTAFFYIGMEASIDNLRSAMVAIIADGFFPAYSPGYYLQYNLQYILVFAVCLWYGAIIKRRTGNPPLASWILTITPPFCLWAILTYYAVVADPLLSEQGLNIYGPSILFGIFSIFFNLAVLYAYNRILIAKDNQTLAIAVAKTPPVWSPESGLAAGFSEQYGLTAREGEIADSLMRGKTNKEIADNLCIALKTVETYLSSVYRKTGAPNRFALYSLIKGQ